MTMRHGKPWLNAVLALQPRRHLAALRHGVRRLYQVALRHAALHLYQAVLRHAARRLHRARHPAAVRH